MGRGKSNFCSIICCKICKGHYKCNMLIDFFPVVKRASKPLNDNVEKLRFQRYANITFHIAISISIHCVKDGLVQSSSCKLPSFNALQAFFHSSFIRSFLPSILYIRACLLASFNAVNASFMWGCLTRWQSLFLIHNESSLNNRIYIFVHRHPGPVESSNLRSSGSDRALPQCLEWNQAG